MLNHHKIILQFKFLLGPWIRVQKTPETGSGPETLIYSITFFPLMSRQNNIYTAGKDCLLCCMYCTVGTMLNIDIKTHPIYLSPTTR